MRGDAGAATMPDPIRARRADHLAAPPHRVGAPPGSTEAGSLPRSRVKFPSTGSCGARLLAAALPGIASPTVAFAAEPNRWPFLQSYATTLSALEHHELAALTLALGAICFAVVTAIVLVRSHVRAARADACARSKIAKLTDDLDRAHALAFSEPQVVITWAAADDEPEIFGDHNIVSPTPRRTVAFGTWLDAARALAMELAVEALRSRGQPFAMSLTTLRGRYVEAEGRAIGGRAVLRIKDLTGAKRDLVDLEVRHQKLEHDIAAVRALIESLPSPIWARDATGRIAWVNAAYARAVEAR